MLFRLIILFLVGLCSGCSFKLNYGHKRREIKKIPLKRSISSEDVFKFKKTKYKADSEESVTETNDVNKEQIDIKQTNVWKETGSQIEQRSRDEDFEEYLEKLFL